MNDDELAEIEARAEAATYGPWVLRGDAVFTADNQHLIANVWNSDTDGRAEFIAHARQDVPALAEEVRRLRRSHGRYCGTCAAHLPAGEGVRIRTCGAPNPFCDMECAQAWEAD